MKCFKKKGYETRPKETREKRARREIEREKTDRERQRIVKRKQKTKNNQCLICNFFMGFMCI